MWKISIDKHLKVSNQSRLWIPCLCPIWKSKYEHSNLNRNN